MTRKKPLDGQMPLFQQGSKKRCEHEWLWESIAGVRVYRVLRDGERRYKVRCGICGMTGEVTNPDNPKLVSDRRLDAESAQRDAALELLNFHRSEIIAAATAVAKTIARANGTVTSTEVLHVLRQDPEWAEEVKSKDRRFMGPVFRRKCWVQQGWASTGSHRRRVPKWALTE